jgi:hypothetical protein
VDSDPYVGLSAGGGHPKIVNRLLNAYELSFLVIIIIITHNISIKSPKPKTSAKQVIKLRNNDSQGHLDPLMVSKAVLSQAAKAI